MSGTRGTGECAQAGIGAAEGLEAAQHAPALVLGQDLRDAASRRELTEVEKRGGCIGGRKPEQFRRYAFRGVSGNGIVRHAGIVPGGADGWRPKHAMKRVFPSIFGAFMPNSVTLDRFDRALLEQVQVNNQVPARRLAERVGLSESAVLRRLRRLRREGVIAADVSIVHPSVLGLPLTVHVLVSLEREGLAELDAFTRKLRARPEVRQAWYVTGEADFVLRLAAGVLASNNNHGQTHLKHRKDAEAEVRPMNVDVSLTRQPLLKRSVAANGRGFWSTEQRPQRRHYRSMCWAQMRPRRLLGLGLAVGVCILVQAGSGRALPRRLRRRTLVAGGLASADGHGVRARRPTVRH